MRLGRFSKAPIERRRYTIDYSNWLDDEETITEVTLAVTPDEVGGLSIDASSILTGARSVGFFASGGVDRGKYDVEVLITTSVGQVREDEINFSVRDY